MPRYRTLITSLLVVVSVAAVVGVLRPAFAADLTPPPISAIQFTPEITIPGLLDGTITISPTSIAEYIKVIFIYFIWTVGVLAVVMVVYGGIRWVAAAGNPGKINDARGIIDNAIIGLLIALSSVVLLNIINPNLKSFNGILVSNVKTEQFGETDADAGQFNESASCTTAEGPIQTESKCAVPSVSFVWPVADVDPVVTSRVGPRNVQVGSTCHPGTDFSTAHVAGKVVLAMFGGTITSSVPDSKCGEHIVTLVSPNGYYARYIHIDKLYASVGAVVNAGDNIGWSGGDPAVIGTKCSSGPHLHVELYVNKAGAAHAVLHDIFPCTPAVMSHEQVVPPAIPHLK